MDYPFLFSEIRFHVFYSIPPKFALVVSECPKVLLAVLISLRLCTVHVSKIGEQSFVDDVGDAVDAAGVVNGPRGFLKVVFATETNSVSLPKYLTEVVVFPGTEMSEHSEAESPLSTSKECRATGHLFPCFEFLDRSSPTFENRRVFPEGFLSLASTIMQAGVGVTSSIEEGTQELDLGLLFKVQYLSFMIRDLDVGSSVLDATTRHKFE
jgi:hypothetical protein